MSVTKKRIIDALCIRTKAQSNCWAVDTADSLSSRFTHTFRFIEAFTRSWYCGTFIDIAFFHDKIPNKRPKWSYHNDLGRMVRNTELAHTEQGRIGGTRLLHTSSSGLEFGSSTTDDGDFPFVTNCGSMAI
jgi:hypothetical protein